MSRSIIPPGLLLMKKNLFQLLQINQSILEKECRPWTWCSRLKLPGFRRQMFVSIDQRLLPGLIEPGLVCAHVPLPGPEGNSYLSLLWVAVPTLLKPVSISSISKRNSSPMDQNGSCPSPSRVCQFRALGHFMLPRKRQD